MPPAASSTAGEHPTLLGLAVLALALAGAAAVLATVQRRTGHERRRPLLSLRHAIAGRVAGLRATQATARTAPSTLPTAALHRSARAPALSKSRDAILTGTPPAASHPTGVRATAFPGARVSPETLKPLAQHVDNDRRLAVADARLNDVLASLPRDRWFVERYVLFAGHSVPFLVLGETGVFAVWGAPGPPRWCDLPFYHQISANIKSALPGYAGPVHAGICRAFEPDAIPRWWCRAGDPGGAWVLGLDWVLRWLWQFGPEHGLGVADIERLRELAGPRWGHPVTDVPVSAHIPTID